MDTDPLMEGEMIYRSRKDVRALLLLPLLAIALTGVSGCSGEWPQSTAYEDGEYRGKPDNLPWQSAGFNGSEHEWQKAIDARTQGQNEYRRIENQ